MSSLTPRLLCLLLGALGWSTITSAVAANLRFDPYATRDWHADDGLPGEQITQLAQDAGGFLWVATLNGMARFDGGHFQPVPLTGVATDYARLMVASSKLGLMAVAAGRRGLLVLREGQFQPWRPEEFHDRLITGLFAARDGALWIACDDGTVVRHAGGKSTYFEPEEKLPRARIRRFATDVEGHVWIASEGTIARYQEGELVPVAVELDGSELRIGSSRRGGPWLVTRDRLLRLENDQVTEITRLPPLLGAHYVQALEEDDDGTLWLGTRSQGLHRLLGSQLEQVTTTHDDVFALCTDREGNLWVGTNGGGLNRIRRKSYMLYDKAAGLIDNQTHTVCEDAEGSVWFANRDGGVARLRRGEFELLAAQPDWPRVSAISVFPFGAGQMGVTSASGTYQFATKGAPQAERIAALANTGMIRVTFAARNGDLWLSLDPGHVGRMRDGRLQRFGAEQGMDGRQVRGMAEDKEGRIWIGAADGKLFRSKQERFEPVSLGGLNPGIIQAIHLDDDGTVWLGTVSGGIVQLAKGAIRTCTTQQGLPDQNITQILEDRYGYFWFGSKRGIFRLRRKELVDCLAGRTPRVAPLVIGEDEGLKDLSCQGVFQPAACQTRDGRLWFATRRGVVSIDPAVQLAPPVPPPVALEEIRCDDETVPLARPFRVASSVHKLELRFGVLNLSAPDRVEVKYRLDGFDDDWVVAGPSRTATYPRLSPGRYQLHVMASSGDGAVNTAGDTVALRVEPQWWQTWWFRVGSGLVAALAVGLVVRAWSLRRLREKLRRVEQERAIEQERRRIAQNIHDDVGASLTRISLLTQQACHEDTAGNAFYDQIHQTATDITRAMDEIVWAVNPKYDDLESLAGYIGDFAQAFLRIAGIRCRLDVPDQLPAIPLSSQVRHHLFLSCKEALNNVVKHANADEVTVSIRVEARSLIIVIRDDGCGHAVAHANGHGGDGARRLTGGAGLENMRRRMEGVDGKCEVLSADGEGASVTFTVPVLPAPAET